MLQLVVHRSTRQIGGNCVELSVGGDRIVLDCGRPLDAAADAIGLLPPTLDVHRACHGVLISHPHQDHYGLLQELPPDWPVYSGAATQALMRLTAGIFGTSPVRDYRAWANDQPLQLGPFRITPWLTDHSAFDAYMLLIEAAGRRVLYSGDFRIHGRKAALVRQMIGHPPENLDVLLLEGTNLGGNKTTTSEALLERQFETLFRETPGRVFVCWSAQNIDRTVTLYRACLRTQRTLVVDLYTAEVLELLAAAGRIPQAGWRNLKIVITRAFARIYEAKGRGDFVHRMAQQGISARQLTVSPERWVIMTRPSLIGDMRRKGVRPTSDDAWSYSQWSGYLEKPDGIRLRRWFEEGGARARHIHTSGHASGTDLRAFAAAMRPKTLVPIHGAAWDTDAAGFANVRRLEDGELLSI